MADTHHEIIHFSGHVQGVGFRYTTLQVSKEYEVAGYVKNLADGRVLLELEGDKREVGQFLATLQERMHGHIKNTERIARRRPAEFQGFSIK